MNNQFDIRRLIGGLLLLCGIVLVITGAVGGAYVKHNAADINIDLGTGLGMLAVGLMMIARAPWSHRTPPHPSRSSRPEPTRPRRQPSGPGNAGAARALRLLAPRTAREPAAPAAHHRRAYLGELVGTTVLLLGTVTVVRWVFATNSALAQALPGLHIKIAVVALTVGTLLGLLIISPLGRSSGGHFNPAMTVSFWLLGALPGADVAPYVTAQALGSVTGTALGRLVWGPIVSRAPHRMPLTLLLRRRTRARPGPPAAPPFAAFQ
jgi:Major intrinsic protein